jgi:hypothetical protein
MKNYTAINIDVGYTELRKGDKNVEVLNCQVLLIDEAENIEKFIKKVKSCWQGYNIGEIEIREISKKVKYFNI